MTATARLRHAPRCLRLLRKGTLARSSHRGDNRLAFSGRMGRRSLPPGRYQLAVTAKDSAGNRSATKTARFTIVKR